MPRRVLLDANLAVLLVVGTVDRRAVARHKRLRAFDDRDYDLLVDALSGYDRIVCTPNVLTEVSNLLRQSAEPWRSRFVDALARFIGEIEEIYVASSPAAAEPVYARLGLTDSGLFRICGRELHLLTTDFALFDAVTRSGRFATNFAHLQAAAFDL